MGRPVDGATTGACGDPEPQPCAAMMPTATTATPNLAIDRRGIPHPAFPAPHVLDAAKGE
jgi:hypothetical protein